MTAAGFLALWCAALLPELWFVGRWVRWRRMRGFARSSTRVPPEESERILEGEHRAKFLALSYFVLMTAMCAACVLFPGIA